MILIYLTKLVHNARIDKVKVRSICKNRAKDVIVEASADDILKIKNKLQMVDECPTMSN